LGYELLFFISALVLLAAIGYGVYRDKTRDTRKDELTEAATREQYRNPERYRRAQNIYEDAAKD
jgi:hypothetical protein